MKNVYRGMFMALMLLGVMKAGSAQEMLAHADSLAAKYTQSSITTPEIANQALSDADHESAYINARVVEQERVCYGKFFTNSCLDEIHEEYRQATKKINAVSIYASRFNRQLRADQTDEKLEQQNIKFQQQEAKQQSK